MFSWERNEEFISNSRERMRWSVKFFPIAGFCFVVIPERMRSTGDPIVPLDKIISSAHFIDSRLICLWG